MLERDEEERGRTKKEREEQGEIKGIKRRKERTLERRQDD